MMSPQSYQMSPKGIEYSVVSVYEEDGDVPSA
jgi:hypothetical protein